MRPALVIAAVLTLAGCAALKGHDAPGCSGARRPANPHGSVLAPEAPRSGASPTPGGGACSGESR